MFDNLYKTERDFLDNCPCAYQILKFVDSIEDTDTRWFFDVCYAHEDENRYGVIFKSYVTHEYKDYILSVEARHVDNDYVIRIVKRIDNLLSDNESL